MNKKNLCILVICTLLLGGCIAIYQTKTTETEVTALHVSNGKLQDDTGRIVALRGMSTHGLGWFPRYVNAGAFETLKAMGSNVIRLAMYSGTPEGYIEEPYNLDFLYMGIENALAANMYVIVDWHILDDNNPLMHMQEASAFFDEISAHYEDCPNIIYEICNEPNGDVTWNDVYDYAMEIIPVIRKNAGDAIVIVGSPEHSTAVYEAMEKPLPFGNLMYSYHKYVDVSCDNEPDIYWLEQAVMQKFPVFVTEWGIKYGKESFFDEEPRQDYGELFLEPAYTFLNYLEENDISWCGWALSNSNEIHAAIRKDCDKISGWIEDDLTPGGKLMFSHFKDKGGKE